MTYTLASSLSQAALGLDLAVFSWINQHRHPLLDGMLGTVSLLGEMSAVWLLACAVMFFFGRLEHKNAATVLFVSLLVLDVLIGWTIKGIWPRERPYLALAGVNVWGVRWENASFPSGHAYASALAAVILGTKFRRALVPLGMFALLTCYSRPYLGMHYPSDVLTGAALGLLTGLLALQIEKAWRQERGLAKPGWWSESSVWSLVFSLIGVGMVLASIAGVRTKPLDLLALGFILGVASFRPRASTRKWAGIAGSVIGLLGLGMVLVQLLR